MEYYANKLRIGRIFLLILGIISSITSVLFFIGFLVAIFELGLFNPNSTEESGEDTAVFSLLSLGFVLIYQLIPIALSILYFSIASNIKKYINAVNENQKNWEEYSNDSEKYIKKLESK